MSGHPFRTTVWVARALSTLAAIILALPAVAHEVEPAVADITVTADRVVIEMEMAVEAPLAGIDLSTLSDTDEAAEAAAYDALRAEPPEALERRLRDAWEAMGERIDLRAGAARLRPQLDAVEVPPVGNTDLARQSRLSLSAPLPEDGSAVSIGWSREMGGLIVRQMGVDDPYDDYLTGGQRSEPIPRSGSAARGAGGDFLRFIAVGFDHIVPKGIDHILFVLGLFFLSLRLRPLLAQVTAFTLAHTATLALGATGTVRIAPEVVEPLIALSIAYVGIENVLSRGLTPWRPAVVFGFGLLHGLGFASVLQDFGLGESNFVAKLIGFNVGVELGQLAVIAVAFALVGLPFGRWRLYRTAIAVPASLAIAAVGLFWTVERLGWV